jgi:L-ascorbate metabolism protein UlaG (beta-lactamase superfamily)
VAGFGAVSGRQAGHEQVLVVLVAGGDSLGGPDRVQDGQVVGVGQGLVAGLGGGQLLAVAFQHASQHGKGLRGGGRWSGLVTASSGEAVIAG